MLQYLLKCSLCYTWWLTSRFALPFTFCFYRARLRHHFAITAATCLMVTFIETEKTVLRFQFAKVQKFLQSNLSCLQQALLCWCAFSLQRFIFRNIKTIVIKIDKQFKVTFQIKFLPMNKCQQRWWAQPHGETWFL